MPVSITREGPIHADRVWTSFQCVESSAWTTIAWEARLAYVVTLSEKARHPDVTLLNKVRAYTELRENGDVCSTHERYAWEVFSLVPTLKQQMVLDSHGLQFPWIPGCEEKPGQISEGRVLATGDAKTCEIYTEIEEKLQVVKAKKDHRQVTNALRSDSSNQAIGVKQTDSWSTTAGTAVYYMASDDPADSAEEAEEQFNRDWDIKVIPGEDPTYYNYDAKVSHCKWVPGFLPVAEPADPDYSTNYDPLRSGGKSFPAHFRTPSASQVWFETLGESMQARVHSVSPASQFGHAGIELMHRRVGPRAWHRDFRPHQPR
jgi:hypothetical protein